MGHLNTLYSHLPVWAQHGAVSAFGLYWHWLRFGPGHAHYTNQYRERERFTLPEWEAWQKERLNVLLPAAATKVPYYQKKWSTGEKAAAIAGQLQELPLLEKSHIRAAPKTFLRQDMRPLHRLVSHTSGSTGTPLVTIRTVTEVRQSMALRESRLMGWAGVSYKMARATFSGRLVEPDPFSKGPFHRFNVVERQVYLSPFHLRPETASRYVDALARHRVQWLHGYAVSYYLLAKLILEQKLDVPPLKAVLTTSEKVTPEMRRTMEKAYGCKVYEEYSTVENVSFASECEHGRLHVSPDAGIVEIIRPNGTACQPGEVGEIVATGLMHDYQPLIRFRLGDMATWDAEQCTCERMMPVLKEVVGRIEDVVIGPDGRRMVRFHGIFVEQPHVREGQIIQETLHRLRVKIVPVDHFTASDAANITQRVQQRLGSQVNVIVELVDNIPRTAAGKFQAVVSLLHEKHVGDGERTGMSGKS